MSKHLHKNSKQQGSQNRLDSVTSIGPEASYQSKSAETSDPYNAQEISIPTQDIQKRAYEIYQLKGGSDLENWLEAEQILREEQRHS